MKRKTCSNGPAEAEKEIEEERRIVNNPGFGVTADEKYTFVALEREIRSAMRTKDPDLLRAKVREMWRLGTIIILRQPGWWVARFEYLEKEKKSAMRDRAQAEAYFAQGKRAINNNDLEALKAAVRQLENLLPEDDADRETRISGVIL